VDGPADGRERQFVGVQDLGLGHLVGWPVGAPTWVDSNWSGRNWSSTNWVGRNWSSDIWATAIWG
jgi:hypothetical protein